MNEQGTEKNLEHLASELSDELEELKKISGSSEQVKKAIVIKDRLLNELRSFLEQKNKQVK